MSTPSLRRWTAQFRMQATGRGFRGWSKAAVWPALLTYGRVMDPSAGAGGLPCLWKAAFAVTCPGCGLSRANAHLVRGELGAALSHNVLIVPVWLLAICLFVAVLLDHSYQRTIRHG